MVLSAAPAKGAERRERRLLDRLLKPAVFAASCLPLVKLSVDAAGGHLTANPISEVLNRFGFWTLTFLCVSLAMTPAKTLFGFTRPMRVRRMVGLFAFFYAFLHFATYLALDQAFDLGDIGADIVKRKFITVGFVAFLLLIPLAVTSTDRAVKRLGFRQWKRVHRLVYAAVALGVVHFVWRVKADLTLPLVFAGIVAALFAVRIGTWILWPGRPARRAAVAKAGGAP